MLSVRVPTGRALDGQVLRHKRVVLVAPGDAQPPADRGGLEVWLQTQPWVSHEPELGLLRRFWRQHFTGRLEVQPALTVPDLRTVLTAVEAGIGVALLPEFLCAEGRRAGRLLDLLGPQPLFSREYLVLAYREADAEREYIRRLAHLLSDGSERPTAT